MNKLLTINYIFIIFIPIILYILIIILSNYKKKSNPYSVSILQENFLLTMYYLDQFYVSCRVYTFIISALYLFSIILIFILIRYIALGQTIILLPISLAPVYSSFYIVFVYVIIFVSLILYKTVLYMLFDRELNKSYLYMLQFTWFRKFLDIIDFKLGEYIIGCIRIPCYQIATLTYKENRYTLNQEHIHHLQNEYLPQKEYIIQFLLKIQNITKRHLVLQKFFGLLAFLLRFLHIHINGISQQLPYVVLVMIFLFELYNKQLHYIFTASFIFFLIRIKRDLNSYRNQRASHYDFKLCDYFYRNSIPYAKQRLLLFPNNKLTKDLSPIITPENQALFYWYKKIVDYTMNNFKWHLYTFDNKKEGIYKRFSTLVCFSFITYHFGLNKIHYNIEGFILICLLILLLLIMGYTGYKTYYPETYEEDPWVAADWKYSRTHNIIFWIVAIIQGYLFWILLLKPELIISDTEVLLDSFIKITRIYTLEEKIMYLYNYFEYVLSQSALPIGEQETIRYLLRQIDYSEIIEINETTTLKEIMYKVKEFIRTEYYARQRDVIVIEYLVKLVEREERLAMNPTFIPWYTLLKNVLFIAAVVPTILYSIQYYSKLWTIINKLQDPYELYRIAGEIMSMDPYGRSFFWYRYTVLEFLTKLKTKLPSVLDIMLVYGIDYIPLQTKLILSGVTTALSGTVLLPKIIAYFETKLSSENLESWNEKGTYVAAPEIGVESTILLNVSLYFCMALLIILIIMWIIYRRKR